MGVSHNPEVVNTHKADYLQKTSMKQKAHYVSLVSWEGRKKHKTPQNKQTNKNLPPRLSTRDDFISARAYLASKDQVWTRNKNKSNMVCTIV